MADPSLSTTWAATLQQGNQPQANLKRTLLDGNLEEELDTSSKDNKDVIISSVFLYEDVKYGTQLTDKGLRWTRATEIG
jgi:sialic acid synthase SpsE